MRHIGHSLVAALLVCSVTGCIPSEPSAATWRSDTEKSVGEVASEVATARLTLEQQLRDAFVGRYPVVVLVYAEEAAGRAVDKVTTTQPPPVETSRYDKVSKDLGDAADLVTRARIAVVAGRHQDYHGLIRELRATTRELHALQRTLRERGGSG